MLQTKAAKSIIAFFALESECFEFNLKNLWQQLPMTHERREDPFPTFTLSLSFSFSLFSLFSPSVSLSFSLSFLTQFLSLFSLSFALFSVSLSLSGSQSN